MVLQSSTSSTPGTWFAGSTYWARCAGRSTYGKRRKARQRESAWPSCLWARRTRTPSGWHSIASRTRSDSAFDLILFTIHGFLLHTSIMLVYHTCIVLSMSLCTATMHVGDARGPGRLHACSRVALELPHWAKAPSCDTGHPVRTGKGAMFGVAATAATC